MATAKKTSSGKWRVQVAKMVDGKLVKKSITANTKAEAEFLAEQWKDNALEKSDNINITFDNAVDNYIGSKSNIISPSTIRGYRMIQKNNIELIKNIKIKNLTKDLIQKQINENAKTYSYKSCKNQLGLITAVLNFYDINFKIALPQKQKTEYTIPDINDIAVIIEKINGNEIELEVLFALMLGLRRSEILALKWENLKENKILIKGAVVPNEFHVYVEKKTNKSTASTRTLTIPDYLLDKLNKIRKEEGHISNISASFLNKHWRKFTEENGLPPFRFHDLRHANASLMLLLNIPDKYAMERLGHGDPSSIKKVYQHTFNKEKNIIDEKINDFFKNMT